MPQQVDKAHLYLLPKELELHPMLKLLLTFWSYPSLKNQNQQEEEKQSTASVYV